MDSRSFPAPKHIEKGNVALRKSTREHVPGEDGLTTGRTRLQTRPSRRHQFGSGRSAEDK